MLESAGVIVRVADNGEQALNRLEDKFITYDAVLMDVHMPVMDGYGATKAIRQKYGDRLPVIALTANATTEEKKRCLELGMSDFLTKPIDSETLFKVLSYWVRLSKGNASYSELNKTPQGDGLSDIAASDRAVVAESVVPMGEVSAEMIISSGAVVSMGDLETRFKAHPTIIPRIFQSFKESFCNFEKEFMDALDASDDETLYRLAHSLKGSASNISAERLRELSADLEEMLKENKQIEALGVVSLGR